MWTRTDDPLTAPNTPQEVTIRFEKGIPVKVSSEGNEWTDSMDLFYAFERYWQKAWHPVTDAPSSDFSTLLTVTPARIDMVENRFIGIKSRYVRFGADPSFVL